MPTYRPMTRTEREAALAVEPGLVTYLPGSADKRFARWIAARAERPEPEITDGQQVYLCTILRRYRRQIRGSQRLLEAMGEAEG